MWAIIALALIALTLASYLTWTTWQAEAIVGCTSESADCDAVLNSPWSKWLGLPVSLFGLLTYLAILAVAWPAAKQPSGWAGTALLSLAFLAAGSAIWFVLVQIIFIGSYCFFCMAIHLCGVGLVVLSILQLRNADTEIDYNQMGALLGVRDSGDISSQTHPTQASPFQPLIAVGIASVGLAGLMIGQFFFAPDSVVFEASGQDVEIVNVDEEPEELSFTPNEESVSDKQATLARSSVDKPKVKTSGRLIGLKGLSEPLDITKYPMIGNPDAPHVFVEMLDYTCKHCRHLHKYIESTKRRYGDQIVFVFYHVPLSKRCNPHVKKDYPGKGDACDFSRLAMSVAMLEPEKFAEYHNWLMESEESPPPIGEARRRAMDLVGEQLFLDSEVRAEIDRRIARHCDSFHNSKAVLPSLLTERGTIRGLPVAMPQWFAAMEQNFGVIPMEQEPENP